MNLKAWILVTRPRFHLLSIELVLLGTCIAWFDGYHINVGHVALVAAGLWLANLSANVLNEYFDYKEGVDLLTKKTPFSGGSGVLPDGLLRPKQVLWLGISLFLLIIPIGTYFVIVRGWLILPILLIGAVTVLAYNPVILKFKWPEWAPGLGMGVLPILGAYFIQTGTYTLLVFIASVPSGILAHNLLLLHGFPDTEADMTANRQTLPITLGKRRASILFSVLTVLVYVWIIGAVIAQITPVFSLIALLTFPLATKAIKEALAYKEMSQLMAAMGHNVIVVLLTQLLLIISYILATIL